MIFTAQSIASSGSLMQDDGDVSVHPGRQADLASWSKVILRVFIERAGMPSVKVLCWARKHPQKSGPRECAASARSTK